MALPSHDRVLHIGTLAAHHVGQNATARIDEPIADLQHRQIRGGRQLLFDGVRGVRMVAIVEEPTLEDAHGIVGQIRARLHRLVNGSGSICVCDVCSKLGGNGN